jgi:hypothetical protein
MRKRALIVVASVIAGLVPAYPALADRDVYDNWHIHSGLPMPQPDGFVHRPAAFFPTILGMSLEAYQADPAAWARCPDATDKPLLPNGANGSKTGAGVCMNAGTVIHIKTVLDGQSPPEGWSPIPGSSTGYYQLTPRG